MKKVIYVIGKNILILLRKPLTWLLLRNRERVEQYGTQVKNKTLSGMVLEFNFWHRIIFLPFFRRVQVLSSDISTIKSLNGPVVFVMKNRGQLEYHYFNYLFLKEKISPIHFANGCLTVHWLPFKKLWQHLVCRLDRFYKELKEDSVEEKTYLTELFQEGKNTLVNLSISRDYLFGLIKTNPIDALTPLTSIQSQIKQPIHVVTLQFHFDKHPGKTELSYFDLLFGEKSQPGAIRKILLFLMNYRRKPRVKFGKPINLQEYLNDKSNLSEDKQTESLFHVIEDDLRIEHARITGPKLRSKENFITEIMADEAFLESIHSHADRNNKKFVDCKNQVLRYLNEIGADVNYSYIHFAHITLRHVWEKIFNGLVVKHDQLNQVREVAGKNPIVLVPMHRSHIDYLLISDLFYEYNITFPYICAGINLNFWPVGKLIRKCGGFFIRRRFRGNYLYKESLYAYVKSLISKQHGLEFFIEGTRSRTGKQLKPKMGILSMVMRAYLEGACDDIYFVPIAVNYDHILEQREYQKETKGDEKKKENAGELFRVRKIFKRKYGKVYVEFAKPLSLKQYCADNKIKTAPIDTLKKEVAVFANHLTHRMTDVAIVTPISLASLAILSMNKKAFNFDQLEKRIHVLKDYLEHKEAVFSDLINYNESYAYHEAVKKLSGRGMLKEVESFEETFFSFDDRRRQDFDYYKNNIVHFYVLLTCICKVVGQIPNQAKITVDELLKRFGILKNLFSHDFIFSEDEAIKNEFIEVIHYAVTKEFVAYDEKTQTITKSITEQNYSDFLTLYSLLDNFLESHLIALRYLKYNKVEASDAKSLTKDILVKAKPMYLRDDLAHPESLSRFNLESSYKVLADLGILNIQRKEGQRGVYSSNQDLEQINQWINSISQFLKVSPTIGGAPVSLIDSPEVVKESQDWQH